VGPKAGLYVLEKGNFSRTGRAEFHIFTLLNFPSPMYGFSYRGIKHGEEGLALLFAVQQRCHPIDGANSHVKMYNVLGIFKVDWK
jgi:hypothetical protein